MLGSYMALSGMSLRQSLALRRKQLGREQRIVHRFVGWSERMPSSSSVDGLSGSTLMVSWHGTRMAAVTGGGSDSLIAAAARRLAAVEKPLLLRWAWEMNGDWFDWGGSPSGYVRAYRRIHRIFRANGADNVAFVWSPNWNSSPDSSANAMERYYPGDDYVDWICADGYNWAPGRQGDQWRSFASIYQDFYDWGLARGKPLMVGEYGAQERDPGEKAKWLSEAREALKKKFQGIKAVVYFDSKKEYDWRVTSSPETLAAFRAMANDPWFTPDPNPLLDAASARPTLPGVPIPLSPLQFMPRTPPKAPSDPAPPDTP